MTSALIWYVAGAFSLAAILCAWRVAHNVNAAIDEMERYEDDDYDDTVSRGIGAW